MTLDEALERMDAVAVRADSLVDDDGGSPVWLLPADVEALGVVLTAARENHSARLVAETNALSAKALEMARRSDPKKHACSASLVEGRCYICGQRPEVHVP
jgi:hypothetical protein